MARINKTKYALLGALSMRPGSGYDIKKFCDFSIAHFWNENYGHIYPVLKQLEDEGLATKETEFTEGKPAKNVYSITEKGREEFHEWLLTPVEEQPIRSELLLKIFFAEKLPLDNVIEKIQFEKVKHEKRIEMYNRIETMLRTQEPYRSFKELPFWLATVNSGKYDSQGMIAWCDETIQTVKVMKAEEKEGDC